VNRGAVYDVEFPGGRRPGVVVTRDVAIPVLANVTVAEVTTTIRGIRSEVPLGTRHGLRRDCVASCDNLQTVPRSSLTRQRGMLGPDDVRRLDEALRVALDLD
jgi:mRNA interferase MazF